MSQLAKREAGASKQREKPGQASRATERKPEEASRERNLRNGGGATGRARRRRLGI